MWAWVKVELRLFHQRDKVSEYDYQVIPSSHFDLLASLFCSPPEPIHFARSDPSHFLASVQARPKSLSHTQFFFAHRLLARFVHCRFRYCTNVIRKKTGKKINKWIFKLSLMFAGVLKFSNLYVFWEKFLCNICYYNYSIFKV